MSSAAAAEITAAFTLPCSAVTVNAPDLTVNKSKPGRQLLCKFPGCPDREKATVATKREKLLTLDCDHRE